MKTKIKIKKKETNSIIIFIFYGELDETNTEEVFYLIYKNLGNLKNKDIILNFRGLKYLNSKSIGYIANLFSDIDNNNGRMYIVEFNKNIKDILELVGITKIVSIIKTEKDAIKLLKNKDS